MKEKKVAIIITTYSQDELLIRNIKSVVKYSKNVNYKIYLVDDCSENRIGKKIEKQFPFVNVIINKENLGFSKSNNIAIQKATNEYSPDFFLILNDDCEVLEKNWLSQFIKKTEKFPGAGIFGCKLVYPDGSMQWGTKDGKNYFFEKNGVMEKKDEFSKDQETTQTIGACMLIIKKAMAKVGGFDELFSPFYAEESDLCFRAKKEGYKVIYFGDLRIVHHRNKSISKLSKEDVWFIKKRNSIRLEWRHYSFLKNIYYTIVHFGATFKRDGISFLKKLILLIKAYIENL